MNTHRKVAVVTGGGRGIGKGISFAMGLQGITIAIVFHNNREEAEFTATQLNEQSCPARFYQADVSNREQVHEVINKIAVDFGGINILVNNAGVASRATTEDLSEKEWDRIVDINMKGTFLCTQAVIPIMIRQVGGRIINISSIAGQTGGQIGPHYAASKAGVIGLTRFMARELGPVGITVNAIAPSGIPTQLLTDLNIQASADRPVQRTGTPSDVAEVVGFLVSDSASYITGQVLSVNGGRLFG